MLGLTPTKEQALVSLCMSVCTYLSRSYPVPACVILACLYIIVAKCQVSRLEYVPVIRNLIIIV